MPLEDLGQLQKELKLLVKPLDALNKIVLTKPDSLNEIEERNFRVSTFNKLSF
jgi:hypothetical protein